MADLYCCVLHWVGCCIEMTLVHILLPQQPDLRFKVCLELCEDIHACLCLQFQCVLEAAPSADPVLDWQALSAWPGPGDWQKNDGEERRGGSVCGRMLSWKSVGGDCETERSSRTTEKYKKDQTELEWALPLPICILICVAFLFSSLHLKTVLCERPVRAVGGVLSSLWSDAVISLFTCYLCCAPCDTTESTRCLFSFLVRSPQKCFHNFFM